MDPSQVAEHNQQVGRLDMLREFQSQVEDKEEENDAGRSESENDS